MSLCDRRQRAATKVVLSCYLDKDRTVGRRRVREATEWFATDRVRRASAL